MPAPTNRLKAALKENRPVYGLWLAMADTYAAEIAGGAGFDWLLVDGEHGPNDVRSIMRQLQVLQASPSEVVVRPPVGETWLIKQLLDIGARSLLVPMVNSAEQARDLVRACQYPPKGVRGVGAAIARASGFNAVPDYVQTADAEICLIVQAESRAAIDDLERIVAVEGVDGVFIGPADLAADMGLPGQADALEVRAVVEDAIRTIRAAGKAAGILTLDDAITRRYVETGATFVGVGTDVTFLSSGLKRLASSFTGRGGEAGAGASY